MFRTNQFPAIEGQIAWVNARVVAKVAEANSYKEGLGVVIPLTDAILRRRLREEGDRHAQTTFYVKMTHECIDILDHLPIEYVYRVFDKANTLISEHESR